MGMAKSIFQVTAEKWSEEMIKVSKSLEIMIDSNKTHNHLLGFELKSLRVIESCAVRGALGTQRQVDWENA